MLSYNSIFNENRQLEYQISMTRLNSQSASPSSLSPTSSSGSLSPPLPSPHCLLSFPLPPLSHRPPNSSNGWAQALPCPLTPSYRPQASTWDKEDAYKNQRKVFIC
eukprot:TRINITY_DN19868_c0_g1_i1.p1 TRINITY_DN19868_c0_g1~~TRINITY_DN19868_c0_g1_i1.p1  ORF type:complete len:106 (-),score=15.58 TRINITY_DN19868_c0_g1_i1:67-384(-)